MTDFQFLPQSSQVDGHHILDDVVLEIIPHPVDNNEPIKVLCAANNNEDNHSICTFKSTVSHTSDPLHTFLFSMDPTSSSLHSQQQPKKKRKRSFQDMIGASNENIVETTSIRSISSSHASSSDGSHSYHSVSITYNSSKKQTITNINRNKNEEDEHSNLSLRWDPHIFSGNTAVCIRIKGVYHPAQIECVTANYFLLKSQHPVTLTPICFKFKYNDYIKDKDRVISLRSASQLTQTQTQSQYINTQQLLLSDLNLNENNQCNDSSELDLYLSDSDDDDTDNNDNKADESENNQQENNISDKEEDCDTIGMRVKTHKRTIYCRALSDISSDESTKSSLFDIEQEYRSNHNGKQIKKRKRYKKKRFESSDDEEDSDSKKTCDDDRDNNNGNKNNKCGEKVKKKRNKVIYWTKVEEDAVIEGYRKYRKYEKIRNQHEKSGLFKAGIFSRICKDEKYKTILAPNNRTRYTVRSKWLRLNSKHKLTEKWDKEDKKKKRKKRKKAKRKRKREKHKPNDKSENDDSEVADS